MHKLRMQRIAALAAAATVVAGCSTSSNPSTSTNGSPTTSPFVDMPATGSVNGMILTVTRSPQKGSVGKTAISIKAELKGDVKAAKLTFSVSNNPSASKGKPATSQQVYITGPGSYMMPKPFIPRKAGNWASTVTYAPTSSVHSTLSVSGLPQVVGSTSPFPQLVTVVQN